MTKVNGININIGNGNGTINVSGGDNVNIDTGNGDHTIAVNAGGNVNIDTGCSGKDTVAVKSNYANINTHDSDDYISFEGNNFNISAVGGNNTILAKGNINDTTSTNSITVGDGEFNNIRAIANNLDVNAGNTDLALGTVGNNLSVNAGDGQHVIAFWGNNVDINLGDGNNLIETMDFANDAGRFTDFGFEDYVNRDKTIDKWTTSSSSSKTSVVGNLVTVTTTTNYTDWTKTTLDGKNNINITTGDGNNTINMTAKNVDINLGDGNQNINIRNQWIDTQSRSAGSSVSSYSYWINDDPLVIDMDGDGEVEATKGQGVDIDGDGQADMAATGGDKMLAMSDLNGNGKVDASEVFGDKTINPFTGEKVSASNGFDALKEIAQSAEAATGITCYSNGKVDLQKLKEALATKGVELGFVSDNNTSTIEALSGVKSINVDDYTQEAEQIDGLTHLERGTAEMENGEKREVHGLWL